jgi:hypothetical protein
MAAHFFGNHPFFGRPQGSSHRNHPIFASKNKKNRAQTEDFANKN